MLGGAANAAEESDSDPVYAYDNDYDPEQNAVATCLHRAFRVLRADGSEGTELRRVRPIGRAAYRVQDERVTRISIR